MLFTNSRSIGKQNNNNNNNNNNNLLLYSTHNPRNIIHKVSKPAPKPAPKPVPIGPKLLWGPAIWYMLHTTAEKIKEESFKSLKGVLLKHIYSICSNLPCPTCSTHAVQYLKKVDLNKIHTKEDLKKMLFLFHNDVNKRLGKQEFTYLELNEKYSKCNYSNVLNVFFKYFQDKHKTVNMLSNDMYTQRISNKILEWILNNRQHFNA